MQYDYFFLGSLSFHNMKKNTHFFEHYQKNTHFFEHYRIIQQALNKQK